MSTETSTLTDSARSDDSISLDSYRQNSRRHRRGFTAIVSFSPRGQRSDVVETSHRHASQMFNKNARFVPAQFQHLQRGRSAHLRETAECVVQSSTMDPAMDSDSGHQEANPQDEHNAKTIYEWPGGSTARQNPKSPGPIRPGHSRSVDYMQFPLSSFQSPNFPDDDLSCNAVGFYGDDVSFAAQRPNLGKTDQLAVVSHRAPIQKHRHRHLKPVENVQVRQRRARSSFSYSSGRRHTNFCYGCDKNPNPHVHVDKRMRIGGGFTYYRHDRPVNPHVYKNPQFWSQARQDLGSNANYSENSTNNGDTEEEAESIISPVPEVKRGSHSHRRKASTTKKKKSHHLQLDKRGESVDASPTLSLPKLSVFDEIDFTELSHVSHTTSGHSTKADEDHLDVTPLPPLEIKTTSGTLISIGTEDHYNRKKSVHIAKKTSIPHKPLSQSSSSHLQRKTSSSGQTKSSATNLTMDSTGQKEPRRRSRSRSRPSTSRSSDRRGSSRRGSPVSPSPKKSPTQLTQKGEPSRRRKSWTQRQTLSRSLSRKSSTSSPRAKRSSTSPTPSQDQAKEAKSAHSEGSEGKMVTPISVAVMSEYPFLVNFMPTEVLDKNSQVSDTSKQAERRKSPTKRQLSGGKETPRTASIPLDKKDSPKPKPKEDLPKSPASPRTAVISIVHPTPASRTVTQPVSMFATEKSKITLLAEEIFMKDHPAPHESHSAPLDPWTQRPEAVHGTSIHMMARSSSDTLLETRSKHARKPTEPIVMSPLASPTQESPQPSKSKESRQASPTQVSPLPSKSKESKRGSVVSSSEPHPPSERGSVPPSDLHHPEMMQESRPPHTRESLVSSERGSLLPSKRGSLLPSKPHDPSQSPGTFEDPQISDEFHHPDMQQEAQHPEMQQESHPHAKHHKRGSIRHSRRGSLLPSKTQEPSHPSRTMSEEAAEPPAPEQDYHPLRRGSARSFSKLPEPPQLPRRGSRTPEAPEPSTKPEHRKYSRKVSFPPTHPSTHEGPQLSKTQESLAPQQSQSLGPSRLRESRKSVSFQPSRSLEAQLPSRTHVPPLPTQPRVPPLPAQPQVPPLLPHPQVPPLPAYPPESKPQESPQPSKKQDVPQPSRLREPPQPSKQPESNELSKSLSSPRTSTIEESSTTTSSPAKTQESEKFPKIQPRPVKVPELPPLPKWHEPGELKSSRSASFAQPAKPVQISRSLSFSHPSKMKELDAMEEHPHHAKKRGSAAHPKRDALLSDKRPSLPAPRKKQDSTKQRSTLPSKTHESRRSSRKYSKTRKHAEESLMYDTDIESDRSEAEGSLHRLLEKELSPAAKGTSISAPRGSSTLQAEDVSLDQSPRHGAKKRHSRTRISASGSSIDVSKKVSRSKGFGETEEPQLVERIVEDKYNSESLPEGSRTLINEALQEHLMHRLSEHLVDAATPSTEDHVGEKRLSGAELWRKLSNAVIQSNRWVKFVRDHVMKKQESHDQEGKQVAGSDNLWSVVFKELAPKSGKMTKNLSLDKARQLSLEIEAERQRILKAMAQRKDIVYHDIPFAYKRSNFQYKPPAQFKVKAQKVFKCTKCKPFFTKQRKLNIPKILRKPFKPKLGKKKEIKFLLFKQSDLYRAPKHWGTARPKNWRKGIYNLNKAKPLFKLGGKPAVISPPVTSESQSPETSVRKPTVWGKLAIGIMLGRGLAGAKGKPTTMPLWRGGLAKPDDMSVYKGFGLGWSKLLQAPLKLGAVKSRREMFPMLAHQTKKRDATVAALFGLLGKKKDKEGGSAEISGQESLADSSIRPEHSLERILAQNKRRRDKVKQKMLDHAWKGARATGARFSGPRVSDLPASMKFKLLSRAVQLGTKRLMLGQAEQSLKPQLKEMQSVELHRESSSFFRTEEEFSSSEDSKVSEESDLLVTTSSQFKRDMRKKIRRRRPRRKHRKHRRISGPWNEETSSSASESLVMEPDDTLDWLCKYCIINPDRLPVYEYVFETRVNEQKGKAIASRTVMRYVEPENEEDAMIQELEDIKQMQREQEEILHPKPKPRKKKKKKDPRKVFGAGRRKDEKKKKKKKKKEEVDEDPEELSPLSFVTRGLEPAKVGLSIHEQYLEKTCFTMNQLKLKLNNLHTELQNLQAEKVAQLGKNIKKMFPEVKDPRYKTPRLKKAKRPKKLLDEDGNIIIPPKPVLLKPWQITNEILISRLTPKMLEQVSQGEGMAKINLDMERTQEKICALMGRLREVANEKFLAYTVCKDEYDELQTRYHRNLDFRIKQSEFYLDLHPQPKVEMNIDQLPLSLNLINHHLLTTRELFFLYIVLDLPSRRKVNFKLFCVVAALSEKVTQLDPVYRKLINNHNYNALDIKMEKARELFQFVMDEFFAPHSTPERLEIELEAGGLTREHVKDVLSKFNREKTGIIDFLDFVTYLPLFCLIHNRIITQPLSVEHDL